MNNLFALLIYLRVLLLDSVVEKDVASIGVSGEHNSNCNGVACGAIFTEVDLAGPRLIRAALAADLHLHPTGRLVRRMEQQALHLSVDQAAVELLWNL